MPIEEREMASTTPARMTVRIPTASGDELEAWLYLPGGQGHTPLPSRDAERTGVQA